MATSTKTVVAEITSHGIIKAHNEWTNTVEILSDKTDGSISIMSVISDAGVTIHHTQYDQLIRALTSAKKELQ
jgi:hypothetical protein